MRTLFILFLTALYVISPIDIIPDVFIGPGQIDDLVVLVMGVMKAFEDSKTKNL